MAVDKKIVFVVLAIVFVLLVFVFWPKKKSFMESNVKYVETPNGKFYYDSMDMYIAESFEKGHIFEEDLVNNKISEYVKNSKVIVDMGANIGSHSISYGNMNKECKIHAFEPQKKLFEILKKNVEENDLQDVIVLYNKAIGHKNGSFKLDPIPENEKYNKGGVKLGTGGEECEMITLDSLNLDGCDFIKMDIQGAEPLAIQGGENTIKKYKPIIFFEYTPGHPDTDIIPSHINLESIPDMMELLKSLGYQNFKELEGGNFLAIHYDKQSNKNTLIFNPVKCEHDFIRLGSNDDGGYVMLDNSFGSSVILGYGVSDDCSFENDVTERFGIKGYIFDHTIEKPPLNMDKQRITFVKEGISDNDSEENLKSLGYHIDKYARDANNIILKMDVEGAEWKSLKNADLSKVSQLIIEMHDMDTNADWELIKRINDNFYLVNIHGNNNGSIIKINNKDFPQVIECTWVRKDLIKNPIEYKEANPLNKQCTSKKPAIGHYLI